MIGLFQILWFAFIACCIFFDISANFGGKEPFKVILSPTKVDIRLPLKHKYKRCYKRLLSILASKTYAIFNPKCSVLVNFAVQKTECKYLLTYKRSPTECECENCDYTCSQKFNLKRHVASVHKGNKPFKCEVCDYNSSQKGHLKQHVASVHEIKKPFKCEICDYGFSQKSHLTKHVASVHEIKKPFKCKICDYTCSKKFNLKRHVASVHEANTNVKF